MACEVDRDSHRGEDILPRSRDAGRFGPARHAPLARGAVRVHVAQRAAGDGLLQDPGGPGVRSWGASGAVKEPALLLLLLRVLLASQGFHPRPTDAIRLDQLGFYPGAPKTAFVLGPAGDTFYVVTADLKDTVFTGLIGPPRGTALSSDTTRAADFSALRTPGRYVLLVPGLGASHPFTIRPGVHQELARAALKAFYFQRASLPLEYRYAGKWSRAAGHPGTRVLVHPSAAR